MGYEDINTKVYLESYEDRSRYLEDMNERQRILAVCQLYSDDSWYASYRLGVLHEDGVYWPKDYEQAYRCYREACSLLTEEKEKYLLRGEIQRLYTAMGRCFLQGKGTEKDLLKAEKYLRKAEDDRVALFLLSDLLEQKHSEEAETCRRKAVEKGFDLHRDWREDLFLSLRRGRYYLYEGTEEDREKGIRALCHAEEILQEIAGKARDESYREEYRDLKKDLLNAADLYPEIWKRINR